MKKYNKYGADFKNPPRAPWSSGIIDKISTRKYLKQLFDQDESKGLNPVYYWHHQAEQVMAIDSPYQMRSQIAMFQHNGVYLAETRELTNQEWCGRDKVYLRIYRSDDSKISGSVDPLAFAFDWMVGSQELIYISFHNEF